MRVRRRWLGQALPGFTEATDIINLGRGCGWLPTVAASPTLLWVGGPHPQPRAGVAPHPATFRRNP
jgi:hypothetical protein